MWEDLCAYLSQRSIGSRWQWRTLLLLAMYLGSWSEAAVAQCNSAPVAVDDVTFHEAAVMAIDVLANDVEPDGEALTIVDVTTDCSGTVSTDLGLVVLEPMPPSSQACLITYEVTDEQGNTASATVDVRLTNALFRDGFESGDTSAWARTES